MVEKDDFALEMLNLKHSWKTGDTHHTWNTVCYPCLPPSSPGPLSLTPSSLEEGPPDYWHLCSGGKDPILFISLSQLRVQHTEVQYVFVELH